MVFLLSLLLDRTGRSVRLRHCISDNLTGTYVRSYWDDSPSCLRTVQPFSILQRTSKHHNINLHSVPCMTESQVRHSRYGTQSVCRINPSTSKSAWKFLLLIKFVVFVVFFGKSTIDINIY